MVSKKDKIRQFLFFLIGRYPFVNAVSLLMLLAERAQREKSPPLEPYIIYANLIVFVLCGMCMSFDMKRRDAASWHALQLVILAGCFYTSKKLKYSDWTVIRMSSRLLGTAGVVLLYNFFQSKKPRPQHYRRLGETLIGLYLFCLFYALIYSKEDSQALLKHLPGGDVMQNLCIGFAGLGMVAYISSYFVLDITYTLVPFITILTLAIDCDMNYWTKKRGMDFWNQFRLLTDNLYIIFGMLLILVCSTYQIKKEQPSSVHTEDKTKSKKTN